MSFRGDIVDFAVGKSLKSLRSYWVAAEGGLEEMLSKQREPEEPRL